MKRIIYHVLSQSFFFFLLLAFIGTMIPPSPAFAVETSDTSFGIANYLPITDKTVKDGDIVSFSPKGYFLSKSEYDALIVGVVTDNPAISLEISGSEKGYPVVSSGNAYVNVVTLAGDIKKGDPITTSGTAGVGMKATRTGYILGAALESYSNTNKRAVKKIAVTLNVHYFVAQQSLKVGLFDILNLSTLATYEEPIKAFKYLVAALTLILSFIFGFFSFARTANKGLEALGRNPLASRMIQLGILLNIVVAVVIVLSGLAVAFIVVRL